MFHGLDSTQGMWTAEEAFSARLFPRGTKSIGELQRRCAENHATSVDSEDCQIAELQPLFSAIGIDGQHDRDGSSCRSWWREVSEAAGTLCLADGGFGKVSRY